MENKKILKMLAAIFALRARYWAEKAKESYDEVALGASTAYSNAFDMLAYAANESWDCLRQFGWADEAEDLIDKLGANVNFWDLEDFIIKGLDKQAEG